MSHFRTRTVMNSALRRNFVLPFLFHPRWFFIRVVRTVGGAERTEINLHPVSAVCHYVPLRSGRITFSSSLFTTVFEEQSGGGGGRVRAIKASRFATHERKSNFPALSFFEKTEFERPKGIRQLWTDTGGRRDIPCIRF